MEFLQGLHDSFSTVRSQILLMEPFPSIQRIYSLVRQEEKQQELNVRSVPTVDSAAFQFVKQSYRDRVPSKRQRPFCDHCNRHGHTREKCFQLHGFPDKHGKRVEPQATHLVAPTTQLTSEQYNKLLALIAKDDADGPSVNFASIALSCLTSCWIIDSGASNHICTSLSLFSSYVPIQKHISVQLPDGSYASVTHIGVVKYSSSFILQDVFYIPSFKFNLLSISQLTKQLNCEVIFSVSHCIFQDHVSKQMIGRGSLQHGLYFLDDASHLNSVFLVSPANKFDLWHSRLGHPCISRFQFLVKKFPDIVANKNFMCDICPQAKQSRDSFPQSISRSSKCFELIHIDIWGPFSVPSKNGSRFF